MANSKRANFLSTNPNSERPSKISKWTTFSQALGKTSNQVHATRSDQIQAVNSRQAQTATLLRADYTLARDHTGATLVATIKDLFPRDVNAQDRGCLLLNAPDLAIEDKGITLPNPRSKIFQNTQFQVRHCQKKEQKVETRDIAKITVAKKAKYNDSTPTLQQDQLYTADIYEESITEVVRLNKSHPYDYFMLDLEKHQCRTDDMKVECGSPLNEYRSTPGLTTPYAYYSPRVSPFAARKGDWGLGSYTFLFAGATKVWIAVKPSNSRLFETKVREYLPTSDCSQFLRHQSVLIAPSLLRQWGVEYTLIAQQPGQLVAVTGNTYHWGINMGANYAEVVNFILEKDWEPPKDYKECDKKCTPRGEKPVQRPEKESVV